MLAAYQHAACAHLCCLPCCSEVQVQCDDAASTFRPWPWRRACQSPCADAAARCPDAPACTHHEAVGASMTSGCAAATTCIHLCTCRVFMPAESSKLSVPDSARFTSASPDCSCESASIIPHCNGTICILQAQQTYRHLQVDVGATVEQEAHGHAVATSCCTAQRCEAANTAACLRSNVNVNPEPTSQTELRDYVTA